MEFSKSLDELINTELEGRQVSFNQLLCSGLTMTSVDLVTVALRRSLSLAICAAIPIPFCNKILNQILNFLHTNFIRRPLDNFCAQRNQ